MPKKPQPSRAEVLEEALKLAVGKVPKDDLRQIVYATIDAFKQGSGMVYSEFEVMLAKLYPSPTPTECEICGRIICDGHIGEGFQ